MLGHNKWQAPFVKSVQNTKILPLFSWITSSSVLSIEETHDENFVSNPTEKSFDSKQESSKYSSFSYTADSDFYYSYYDSEEDFK